MNEIKYGVIMTENLYIHIFAYQGTLQLQKNRFLLRPLV